MRVKRYIVDSMPEALQQIRADLGKNAVILNTKEIRSGGFLGMFGKKKIEVIAAVESTPPLTDTKNVPLTGAQTVQRMHEPAMYPKPNSISSSINRSSVAPVSSVATIEKENPYAASRTTDVAPPSPATSATYTSASNDAYASTSPLTVREPWPNEAGATPEQLMEEIRKMKRIMQKIAGEPEEPELPPAMVVWKKRLLAHEFLPQLADKIIEQAMQEYEKIGGELDMERANELIRDQLRKLILREPVREIADDTRVVHFVGPTGVGKTTTLAKLAALQTLKHHKDVAFVTADTYRIAAVEQLKTYANILNVPLEVVNSHQDLIKAFDMFRDKDLIFMDTAGRNFRNEMYVSELNSLLGSFEKSETYLVLSLTMKYRDMLAVAQNFAKFRVSNVLFTKLDETDSYGPVFNLLYDTNYRPSYIANGQNVPEDIAKLNADRLIELLMEEPAND